MSGNFFNESKKTDIQDTESRAKEILSAMKHSLVYYNAKYDAQQEVLRSSKYSVENMEASMFTWLETAKCLPALKNAIYDLSAAKNEPKNRENNSTESRPRPVLPQLADPVDILLQARTTWDARLRYELRSVATKQKRKLVRPRSYDEPQPDYIIRFVYTSEDLLEAAKSLQNPNSQASFSNITGFGMINLSCKTPSLFELRKRYQNLRPDVRQVGVDDVVPGQEWFQTERMHTGTSILEEGYLPALRTFTCTGVPSSLRPYVWSKLLGVEADAKEYRYYDTLISQIHQWDLITDDLTRFDVQDCTDHDEFFVFEDTLDEVMLAFSRDSAVPGLCALDVNTARLKAAKFGPQETESQSDNLYDTTVRMIPPNCIVPFHGQSLFCAPIAYLYTKHEEIYFLFRALYTRYWHKLHVMSSDSESIISLGGLFENLLITQRPDVFYHATQLGCQPLSIAFPWMFSAFVGILSIDQVLILWDRVLGYDSLEMLAILSAALFMYRADNVLQCQTAEELVEAFAELNNVKIVPLLQLFLFGHHSALEHTPI